MILPLKTNSLSSGSLVRRGRSLVQILAVIESFAGFRLVEFCCLNVLCKFTPPFVSNIVKSREKKS